MALTDSTTADLGESDSQSGRTTDTLVAKTSPTVVDTDEVYVETSTGCSNDPERDLEFVIEFKLTVDD